MEDIKCHITYFNDLVEMMEYINDRKVSREDLVAIFPMDRKFVLVYYG